MRYFPNVLTSVVGGKVCNLLSMLMKRFVFRKLVQWACFFTSFQSSEETATSVEIQFEFLCILYDRHFQVVYHDSLNVPHKPWIIFILGK